MVGEMLSQEEINALLGGMDLDNSLPVVKSNDGLSPEQIDALGEIGNISMGTAATTLFALLNHKVMITTPQVQVLEMEEFKNILTDDLIAISVDYTEGLVGTNLLILNERDVKIIADLMMGGEGNYTDEPISEFHLSAIAEAMNQMIGSASTSMSQMFEKRIDISPPLAVQMSSAKEYIDNLLQTDEAVVKISFRMQILENIIDSELMQVVPISFAKDLVNQLLGEQQSYSIATEVGISMPITQPEIRKEQVHMSNEQSHPLQTEPMNYNNYPNVGHSYQPVANEHSAMVNHKAVEVQELEFPSFDKERSMQPVGNMDILLDVALEVSVELGRTKKKIKEILEFGPGTVIELDRLVGEPIDVLVNGKYIAKGEVVVIDENFGIRITDIIKPENRI